MPGAKLFPSGKKMCVCITAIVLSPAINCPAMKLYLHLPHRHEHYLCGQLEPEHINTANYSMQSPSNPSESV